MNRPDLHSLPDIQLHGEEPVFEEPWQAQAFAMVVALHERGVFTWSEWADTLSSRIKADESAAGDIGYYHHWLRALEDILEAKNLTDEISIKNRTQEWHRAAHATPHGDPITLENDPQRNEG